jgi:hypothetical protein
MLNARMLCDVVVAVCFESGLHRRNRQSNNKHRQRTRTAKHVEHKYQKIRTIDPRSSRSEACNSEFEVMDCARVKTASNAFPDVRYEC